MNVRYVHVVCNHIQIFPWKKRFKKLSFHHTMILWQDLIAGFCFEPGYFACFCAHNITCMLHSEYKQQAYLAAHSSKTKK